MSIIADALEVVIKSVGVEGIVRFLCARNGPEQIKAMIDAQMNVADAVADKDESDKFDA